LNIEAFNLYLSNGDEGKSLFIQILGDGLDFRRAEKILSARFTFARTVVIV